MGTHGTLSKGAQMQIASAVNDFLTSHARAARFRLVGLGAAHPSHAALKFLFFKFSSAISFRCFALSALYQASLDSP